MFDKNAAVVRLCQLLVRGGRGKCFILKSLLTVFCISLASFRTLQFYSLYLYCHGALILPVVPISLCSLLFTKVQIEEVVK